MQRAVIAAILPSPALCYFGRTQAPVLLRSGNLFPTEEVGGVGGPNSQAFCRRCFSRFVDGFTSYRTKPKPPWNVLFFGTDEYALTHLKALNANRWEIFLSCSSINHCFVMMELFGMLLLKDFGHFHHAYLFIFNLYILIVRIGGIQKLVDRLEVVVPNSKVGVVKCSSETHKSESCVRLSL